VVNFVANVNSDAMYNKIHVENNVEQTALHKKKTKTVSHGTDTVSLYKPIYTP